MRATHTLQFRIQNRLPKANDVFDSRLVIVMPAQMTGDSSLPPDVKNLDGNILAAAIAVETTYPGCSGGTVVCYAITHSNFRDIPEMTTLKFSITGTVNQESVQDAGQWSVQTQIFDVAVAGRSYYNIDAGTFDSGFMTTKGGISLTTGEHTSTDNAITYAKPATYTLKINLGNYIPQGGTMKLDLPSDIKLVSTPFSSSPLSSTTSLS